MRNAVRVHIDHIKAVYMLDPKTSIVNVWRVLKDMIERVNLELFFSNLWHTRKSLPHS